MRSRPGSRTTLGDGWVVIDLAGPESPPKLHDLLKDLRAGMDPDTKVEVTWTPRHRVSVSGGS